MDIELIDKYIQQEKDDHAKTINRLQKEICKANERHQRNLEYWRNKKEQVKTSKAIEQKIIGHKTKNELLEKLYDVIKQAKDDIL